MRAILADPFWPPSRRAGAGHGRPWTCWDAGYGRVETSASTEPRAMNRPSRSPPFHSHMGQVVDEPPGVRRMRMPGAERSRARVPSGLSGAGGMKSGSPAPHVDVAGFTHVGLIRLLMMTKWPSGVG